MMRRDPKQDGIKKIYTVEQLQSSEELKEKMPPQIIEIILLSLTTLFLLVVILITCFKLNISVKANATVEPTKEMIILKANSKAQIEEIYKKDGEEINEGETILKLKSTEKEVSTKLLNDTIENLKKKKEALERLHESIKTDTNKLKEDDELALKDEYQNYIQSKNTLQQENITPPSTIGTNIENLTSQINQMIDSYNNIEDIEIKNELQHQITQGKTQLEQLKQEQQAQNEAQKIRTNQTNSKIQSLKTQTQASISAKLSEVEESLKAKTSELENDEKLNEELEIKAPEKGKIKLEKTITKNNTVEQSQPLVTLLPEGSKNKVTLYLEPKDIKELQKDQNISIRFDNEQKSTVKAKVTEISDIPTTLTLPSNDKEKETTVALYEVKVDVQSGDEKLAYGMTGVAEVKVGEETLWNFIKRKLFGGIEIRK